MTPDQFLAQIAKQPPAPAYLFLGPEGYFRDRCRRALIERVLTPEERDTGYTRHDLDDVPLAAVMDDARSLSLFAGNRVIWAGSAESAVPRARASAGATDEDSAVRGVGGGGELESYLKNPTPGAVIVFDASRYDFEREDKTKLARVQKFYGAVKSQVEFAPLSVFDARRLAGELAKTAGIRIGAAELDLLVDMLGVDAARVAAELEKLSLFAGENRVITAEDIANLAPNARASTIFALVNALARLDRPAALDALDVLDREGEYLPLALTFLATQFRLALAAREAGLSNASQIQAHFSKLGTPMWRSRAEQVQQTMQAFPLPKLKRALQLVHETDKALRDTRPDDRTVMESFVLKIA